MKKIYLIISILILVFMMSCGEPLGPFKVIYHSNESTSGYPPTDPKDYKTGEYATVFDQGTLLNSDHDFDGWNTKADSTGTTYKPGEKIKIKNINIFLFPVWK
jgi:hypothetical protein